MKIAVLRVRLREIISNLNCTWDEDGEEMVKIDSAKHELQELLNRLECEN